jgi:hypothetical protein
MADARRFRRGSIPAAFGLILGIGLVGGLGSNPIASATPKGVGGAQTGTAPGVKGAPSWIPSAPTLPSDAASNPSSSLNAEHCVSSSFCVAVGQYYDASGAQQGLIENLSGGSWTATKAPLPANASTTPQTVLNAVTCPSVGSCIAVGWYSAGDGIHAALIETLTVGSWTASEAPLPAGDDSPLFDGLAAASCPSAGFCVAVGSFTVSGGNEPLIETLSAGSWVPTQASLPSNAIESYPTPNELNALTCTSSTDCVAVGTYATTASDQEGFFETLSGTSWTSIDVPLPSGFTDSSLEAVSCASVGHCAAVGNDETAQSGPVGLLETLASGAWSPDQAPVPSNGGAESASVNAVTCSTSASCVAVGQYSLSSGQRLGLIENLAGATWISSEAPATGVGQNTELNAVTCTAATSCIAVGTSSVGQNYGALIETLAGGTWSAIVAPLPADGMFSTGLGTVTCPGLGACVAVGVYGNDEGLIEILSAGTWSATEAPVPADARFEASASTGWITCSAVGACHALGEYYDTVGKTSELIETLASGAWTATALPLPANAVSTLTYGCPQGGYCGTVTPQDVPGQQPATSSAASLPSVTLTCPTVSFCVATASYFDSSGNIHGLIDTLSDGVWTATDVPPPAESQSASVSLNGVSCSAPGSCAAVGSYAAPPGDPGSQNFIEMLSGGTWRQVAVPLPATSDSNGRLSAISCFGQFNCEAVGSFTDSNSDGQALIATLAKGHWTAAAAPLPANSAPSPNTQLNAISCPASGSCHAVGYYEPSTSSIESPNYGGLIIALAHGKWTAVESPPPSQLDYFFYGLNEISCANGSFCVALGDGLDETLEGGTWTGTNPPALTGASFQFLDAVSCPTTGSCATVGQFESSTQGIGGLIDELAKGSWTALAASPANDPEDTSSYLEAVSCTSPKFCVSVGGADVTPYKQQSYAETLTTGGRH